MQKSGIVAFDRMIVSRNRLVFYCFRINLPTKSFVWVKNPVCSVCRRADITVVIWTLYVKTSCDKPIVLSFNMHQRSDNIMFKSSNFKIKVISADMNLLILIKLLWISTIYIYLANCTVIWIEVWWNEFVFIIYLLMVNKQSILNYIVIFSFNTKSLGHTTGSYVYYWLHYTKQRSTSQN